MKTLQEFTAVDTRQFFSSDTTFQNLLSYHTETSEYSHLAEILSQWQAHLGEWNMLADEAARPEKLPRIERFDRVGNPIDRVVVPLETRLIRHRVVQAGIFNNQNELEKFSKIYLLSFLGESGVTCPLACTDGLIRVLEAKGSEYLKNKYLDQLKSIETPLSGAQFITERAGGSDVGAIEMVAKPDASGNYRLYGKKWYCSTPEEFYAVAARVEGAEPGTKGVSLFFVPRMTDEDTSGTLSVNNLTINKLKDKLGTQSLPTAEIDFNGSLAYLIGVKSEGFSNLMNYVINCSRLHNTAAALGIMRRSFIEARNYAAQRVAFGTEIINQPLVAESLLRLESQLAAKLSLFLATLAHVDRHGWMPKDKNTGYWQRFLINLCKYRSAETLSNHVKEAILVFGANGIINDFSILPRLLRDALVVETWEGTHNTLCLQIMRDAHKFDLLSKLNQEIENIINAWPDKILRDSKKIYAHAFDSGAAVFKPKNLYSPEWEKTHARRLVNHYADLFELGSLVRLGIENGDSNLLIQASFLIHEKFGDRLTEYSSPAHNNVDNVYQDVINEKPIDIEMK